MQLSTSSLAMTPPDDNHKPVRSVGSITLDIRRHLQPLTALGTVLIAAQWVKPQANSGAKGFFSVTLADTTDHSISIDGFIWDQQTIRTLLDQGKQFGIDLADRESRREVVLEGTIDFWQKKTKPYIRIHRLSDIGMKGLRQQQREAVLQRLAQEQLLRPNKERSWRLPTLRLALITKEQSDAARDAIAMLEQSQFRFHYTLLHVSVQGVAAEPSLLQAFDHIHRDHHLYDAVLLVRGGGGELDLIAYDSYPVAKAIALCPIPVITGLGHQADHSIADVVAHIAAETPTAAARLLVDRNTSLLNALDQLAGEIRSWSTDSLYQQQQRLDRIAPEILANSTSVLHQKHQGLRQFWFEIQSNTNRVIDHYARQLDSRTQTVQSKAALHCQRLLSDCTTISSRIVTQSQIQLSTYQTHLERTCHYVGQHVQQQLNMLESTMRQWATEVATCHPDRYFRMGLCYVTRKTGELITQPTDVTAGQSVCIHLSGGHIKAKVTSTTKPPQDHHA